MELKVLILGWRNTGQGEHPTCKCGTWAIFLELGLYSCLPDHFFLLVSRDK